MIEIVVDDVARFLEPTSHSYGGGSRQVFGALVDREVAAARRATRAPGIFTGPSVVHDHAHDVPCRDTCVVVLEGGGVHALSR